MDKIIFEAIEISNHDPKITELYQNTFLKTIDPLLSNDLLEKDIPPKKILLSPWLKENEIVMIYAAPGIGKTFFALNCANSLTNGIKFLHFEAKEKIKVMYIDGEMDLGELQDRWKNIIKNNKKTEQNSVSFYTPSLFPDKIVPKLCSEAGRNFYYQKIKAGNFKVIFFDNLSILTEIDENKSQEWSKILTWFIQLKNEGVTSLLVHHTNKGGKEHRGSSKLRDFLNIAIHLEEVKDESKHNKGARFKIKYDKARSIYGNDTKEIEAWLDENGLWHTQDQAISNREKVREYHSMGMSAKDISLELNINIATVYRNLDDLETAGMIKKRTHGNRK